MAVYGVGAYYDRVDVSKDFIDNKCFCIGYGKTEASSLYEMLRRAKKGDIVYIKSFSPKTNKVLYLKAIGFIMGVNIKEYKFTNGESMGCGREVKWIKDFSDSAIKIPLESNDSINNVYNNTMYEEYSARIIEQIIELMDVGTK